MPFTAHVTLSPCCRKRERERERETPRVYPSRDVATQFANPVDYSIWGILQERVYRSQIHDVKELKEVC